MTTTRTPRRSIAVGLALCATIVLFAGCAGSAGTSQEQAATGGGASDAAALYVGSWAGSFDLSMAAGSLQVTFNYDGTVWSGELNLDADGQSLGGAVENFTITEDGCTFTCFIEMADLFLIGHLEEGSLVGVMEVYAESELVADGTFTLSKKQD